MFIRGLRTKIAINIAILFFVAMLLINIVTVMTAKRDIIRNEAARGHFVMATLEADLLKSLKSSTISTPNRSRAQVFRLLTEAGVSNALVLSKNNDTIYFGNTPKSLKDELMQRCRKVIQSEKQETKFSGTTWGVFWKQRRNLIISTPILRNGHALAAAASCCRLKGFTRPCDIPRRYYLSFCLSIRRC